VPNHFSKDSVAFAKLVGAFFLSYVVSAKEISHQLKHS